MMTRTAKVALNAASNYLRFLIALVVMFVLMPYIIKQVGKDDFGLWSLVLSVLGFLGLLDFGFGTGVIKYVAECRGSGDLARRNVMLSTVALSYLILAGCAILIVAGFSLGFNQIFGIPQTQHGLALELWWLLALRMVILALPLSLYRGILFGEQRIAIVNIIQSVSVIVNGVLTWYVLGQGWGLLAMAWVSLGTMVVEHLAYVVMAYQFCPQLRVTWSLANRSALGEVMSFSLFAFMANIAGLILLRTDPILVQLLFGLQAVAVYTVALRIAENEQLLAKQFTNVFMPIIAELKGGGEERQIRFVLVNCAKFALAPALMLAVIIWIYAHEGINYWIKQPSFGDAALVLSLLTISCVVAVPQMLGSNILAMTGHHRFTGLVAISSALFNVVASIILAYFWGIFGIALGTVLASLVFDWGLLIQRACSIHGIRQVTYFCRVFLPCLIPATGQAALTILIKYFYPPQGLWSMLGQALPGVVVFIVIFAVFAIERSEWDLIYEKLLLWKQTTEAVPQEGAML